MGRFIQSGESHKWLGVFDEIEDAARAYIDAVLIHQLEHTKLNWATAIEECD